MGRLRVDPDQNKTTIQTHSRPSGKFDFAQVLGDTKKSWFILLGVIMVFWFGKKMTIFSKDVY